MSESKPGLFGRLFGRGSEPKKLEDTPDPVTRADEALPTPASPSEGLPDFSTAAATGQLPPVEPTVTTASPDQAPEENGADELAGADMQPVYGAPEGGAPKERNPRPEPDAPGPAEVLTSEAASQSGGAAAEPKRNWWQRLSEGMRRTSASFDDAVLGLLTKRKLDATTLEDLEDALVRADLGIETATRITEAVQKGRYEKGIGPDAVRAILAQEVETVLRPVAKPLAVDRGKKPFVLLMVGVNGSGKTTTIGKLARRFQGEGLTVVVAAGDTFRAAAIEQLKVWAERAGATVFAREQGADSAGLAFDAFEDARERGADVLMIDTAGRLQNKAGLMAELEKIVRVLKKLEPDAPHATLLVLDATVGQNALSQVELFHKVAGVTGLVMTKLDGTARGGILVALAQKFGLPVHFIGVGEGAEDLQPFAARDFARAIAGLGEAA